jgi:hypothetical protein
VDRPGNAAIDAPEPAAWYRRYVLTMLGRDAAHDKAGGDPEAAPVRLSDYRRAVCALVASWPLPVWEAGRGVTAGEGRAWLAGHHAWREAMTGTVAGVWREATERRRARAWMSRRRLLSRSVGMARLVGVGSDLDYVRGMVIWDVEFDEDPEGDPPLLVSEYRAGLVAVMGLEPAPLVMAGRWVTGEERAAYDAGQRAAYDAGQRAAYDDAAVAVGLAWRPDRAGR